MIITLKEQIFVAHLTFYILSFTSTLDIKIEFNSGIFIINLFLGVYGDVHRVKILFNKKDSALIQFAAPQQAAVGKSRRQINID